MDASELAFEVIEALNAENNQMKDRLLRLLAIIEELKAEIARLNRSPNA
jgi:hypothetical protein